MTRDDIIRMAREAGFVVDDTARQYQPNCIYHTWHMIDEGLERFAALVAAHERAACAAICDDKVDAEYATGKVDHNEIGWTQACAAAIRARGDE